MAEHEKVVMLTNERLDHFNALKERIELDAPVQFHNRVSDQLIVGIALVALEWLLEDGGQIEFHEPDDARRMPVFAVNPN